MGISSRLTVLLAASAAAQHAVAPRDYLKYPITGRAFDDAPEGYTPGEVDCPSDPPTIRDGSKLSEQERDWVMQRRNETITPIRELLQRIAIPDFDSEAYLRDVETDPEALPNIGLAFSGGGYRAMLAGAGNLAALDSRSTGSDAQGNLGGLFQSSTYIAGLSGGGWLVGSLYTNNITTVEASVNSGNIWQFDSSILEGPEQYSFLDYYTSIFGEVDDKDEAGWERSITDYWGRMLSYQLVNATDGGPGYTFSSIAENEDFNNGRYPLPFLVAVGRKPDEEVIALNSTVYEFSPWELGTSDPGVQGYVPLRWAGSNFSNGEIASNGECVRGFDNVGFVMGTSSSLFNAFVLYLNDDNSDYVPDGIPDFVISGLTSILESWGDAYNDIADWTPNPFKGWNSETNYNADEDRLTLVDGGEDLQNVPYHPLIRNEREVDVIFSFDNSADTENNWPDGASIIATYERSLENISEGTSFPAVPGKASFMNLELNTKPVFFGCDATNTTEPSPLIVYIPNYPYVFNSNTSTFSMEYSDEERDAMISNGWAVATMGNSTRDANWSTCVGCAMLKRSFGRTNTTVPQRCNECFDTYCWDGRIDEAEPAPYEPSLVSPDMEVTVDDAGVTTAASGMLSLAVAGVVATILSL